MGDDLRRPATEPAPPRNPACLSRRRMLLLMGAGTLASATALGAAVAGCAGPPLTVRLDLDPEALEPGTPTEIPFTIGSGAGAIAASAWLVRKNSGEIIAFDPRCTHALCRYEWSESAARFACRCHEGFFALDGTVLSGPPPRALGRFPVRLVEGGIEVDVPSDFQTPRESLPA